MVRSSNVLILILLSIVTACRQPVKKVNPQEGRIGDQKDDINSENTPMLPKSFIIHNETLGRTLLRLMEWYKYETGGYDISYIVYPMTDDVIPQTEMRGNSCADVRKNEVRRSVDLSGLSLDTAFRRVAKTFDAEIFFHMGVYYIGPAEIIDYKKESYPKYGK